MKINIVPTLIAAAISALLAYALFSICKISELKLMFTIGGFVCFFLTLAVAIAVRFAHSRSLLNTTAVGWLFFIIMCVSHAIFACVHFNAPAYIIINGIILLSFIGVIYAVSKARQ